MTPYGSAMRLQPVQDRPRERLARVGPDALSDAELVATGCAMPVREVLSLVLRHDGIAFAVAHNHPSGCIDPSPADLRATERLAAAAGAVGPRLLNHVIVTGNDWRSITASR